MCSALPRSRRTPWPRRIQMLSEKARFLKKRGETAAEADFLKQVVADASQRSLTDEYAQTLAELARGPRSARKYPVGYPCSAHRTCAADAGSNSFAARRLANAASCGCEAGAGRIQRFCRSCSDRIRAAPRLYDPSVLAKRRRSG